MMKTFHEAVRLGSLDDIKQWIDNGADIDSTDINGNTPLMLAVIRQRSMIVRYLLSQNPDLFKANNNKQTPITAARGKDETIIRMLVIQHAKVEHLAQINSYDTTGLIINKLITTLLYKSKRHGWDDQYCKNLRYYINSLNSSFKGMDEKEYESYLLHQETTQRDFFGSWLSDDSDSEEEHAFLAQPEEDREAILSEAKISQSHAQRNNLFYRKKNKDYQRGDFKIINDASSVFKLQDRMQIHHPKSEDMDAVKRDLERLNAYIELGYPIEEAQKRVVTEFKIAQYRGVTYLTSRWNKPAREGHRKADELGQPQYSASVYKAAGIDIFKDYADGRQRLEDPKTRRKVTWIADTLRELLLTFREPRPLAWKGYSYSTYAYFLQNLYTQAYDAFHRYISQDPMLSKILINDANPFLSTGGTPYHADKYAYGIKPYKGHKDERLRPRWNKTGRAERPYSGAVYVSLHPLTDFDVDGPLHIPTLTWDAEIRLSSELNIVPEKESCFPSFLPGQRVIYKHIAKYPSFVGPYKQIYLAKYGIDEAFYSTLQDMLEHAAPHTKEMVAFKQILGEWLCGFHEVRLIEIARKKAEEDGYVLIYKGLGKTFSLTPPIDSPRCNTSANTEEVKSPINEMVKFRRMLARDVGDRIVHLTKPRDYSHLLGKIDESLLSDHGLAGVDDKINPALTLPMAFALNALKHKRYFALRYMLRTPYFINCFNNPFNRVNTDRLLGASLLHLAVVNKDRIALELLLNCKALQISRCDQSINYSLQGRTFYEKISPLALAIISNQQDIFRMMLSSKRFNIKEEVGCVSTKDVDNCEVQACSDDGDQDTWERGFVPLAQDRLTREPEVNLVQLAIEHATPKVVVMLLLANAPSRVRGASQRHALSDARREQLRWFFTPPPKTEDDLIKDLNPEVFDGLLSLTR